MPRKKNQKIGIVKDCVKLNVRECPDVNSNIIDVLYEGEKVDVKEQKDGWCKLGNDGYVMSEYVSVKE